MLKTVQMIQSTRRRYSITSMTSKFDFESIDMITFCNCNVIILVHLHVYTICENMEFIAWQYYMENGMCFIINRGSSMCAHIIY